ncbi:MAG: short-chain dehydrogenase, partial [Actinomycetota bacterium]|nr:short-chain dehydrogenase [Actinomycetota bacterium]
MPALNTPQFRWVKTRLPRHPQPVPPIFQPEVAAEGIVWVSQNYRRELYVGAPTTATILADKVAPGALDHYLGRTGFKSQQTDEPVDAGRPNNLWEPVKGDAGARGEFDSKAHDRSAQLEMTMRRGWLIPVAAVAGGVLLKVLHRGH